MGQSFRGLNFNVEKPSFRRFYSASASGINLSLWDEDDIAILLEDDAQPTLESLVSDIPAEDGKTANLFLQCMTKRWVSHR